MTVTSVGAAGGNTGHNEKVVAALATVDWSSKMEFMNGNNEPIDNVALLLNRTDRVLNEVNWHNGETPNSNKVGGEKIAVHGTTPCEANTVMDRFVVIIKYCKSLEMIDDMADAPAQPVCPSARGCREPRHGEHAADPFSLLNVAPGHNVQVERPVVDANDPAKHAAQMVWPAPDEKYPLGHGMPTDRPVVLENVPTGVNNPADMPVYGQYEPMGHLVMADWPGLEQM